MRRKVLQDFANTICQMFVGWSMGDDAETLAEIGEGVILIDLLAGTASANGRAINLWITGELQAWFLGRLDISTIDRSLVNSAVLEVAFITEPVPQKKRRGTIFSWKCRSAIVTDELKYEGELIDTHTWMGVG